MLTRSELRAFLKDQASTGRPRFRVKARRALRNQRAMRRLAERLDLQAVEEGLAGAPPGGWLAWLIDHLDEIEKILDWIFSILDRF